MTSEDRILAVLNQVYGESTARQVGARIQARLTDFVEETPSIKERRATLSQQDAILITYGDQVRQPGAPPLKTLAEFGRDYLKDVLSGVHILPFFPYSSDDGFSVIDYCQVNPELGTWDDITRLDREFRLMFDAVINHISVESDWFQAFLKGETPYEGYFITVEPGTDLSMVVRPRALPLLTEFTTPSGPEHVWTTFSADQVDLNYASPHVLLEIIDVLLFYVRQGAEFIRLDAIAYLWKETGTSCIHLPQTHAIVQLFRAILDLVTPFAMLITETNVPHTDNISYFGDGTNEAQLVYNFALPPLVLHAIHQGRAEVLSKWAADLSLPSEQTTFFNFLASHDGVGLNPARGILPESEIEAMVARVQSHGGLVSYKTNADGTQSPYELNVNYFDALSDPRGTDPPGLQVDRFVAAHAIMLCLVGVPGIYFHSLFGSRGWPEGVAQTGHNRTINRQKLNRAELEAELAKPGSICSMVYQRLAHLLKIRSVQPAFHPHGKQRVLGSQPEVFALMRVSPDGGERVLCLVNLADQPQPIRVDLADLGAEIAFDLIDRGKEHYERLSIDLPPYQIVWLKLA